MTYTHYVLRKSYEDKGEYILLDKVEAKLRGYEFKAQESFDTFQPRKSIYSEGREKFDLNIIGFNTIEYAKQFVNDCLAGYELVSVIEFFKDI